MKYLFISCLLFSGLLITCNSSGNNESLNDDSVIKTDSVAVDRDTFVQYTIDSADVGLKDRDEVVSLNLKAPESKSPFLSTDFLWVAPDVVVEHQKNVHAESAASIVFLIDEWYASHSGAEAEKLFNEAADYTDDEGLPLRKAAVTKLQMQGPQFAAIKKDNVALKDGKSSEFVNYIPLNILFNLNIIGNFISNNGEEISFNGVNVYGIPNAFSYITAIFDGHEGALSYILITSDKDIYFHNEEGCQYRFFILERTSESHKLYEPVWKEGAAPEEWEIYAAEEFGFSPSKGKLLYELSLK